MKIQMMAVVLGSVLLSTVSHASAQDTDKPMLRLRELPKIELTTRPAVTDAEAKHIKQLIASLADLDMSQLELESIGSGSAFAPVLTRREEEKRHLDNRISNTWPAFRELVSLGPDALPCLLDALDDNTPTKIVYTHEPDERGRERGGMYYGTEFWDNPVDPAEKPGDGVWLGRPEEVIHTYTIKVGDICFLAIGQIVGRAYPPARYQSTACFVINSPAHDPRFCRYIRKAWTSPDPRQRLFDSLRTDYATEAAPDSEKGGGPDMANEFQCSAATRLLYYFPKESAALIAARLDKMVVTVPRTPATTDSLQLVEFVKAVAWSPDAAVRAAIARIFERTDDPDMVLTSAPAVDDKAILTPRLLWAAGTIPADLSNTNADNRAAWVVKTLIERIPESAEAPLREFLKNNEPFRTWLVSDRLVGSKLQWDIDLLAPLLADKREDEDGPDYYADRKTGPLLFTRVCDNVAVTLAANHPDLKFQLLGTHDDLDKQITIIRTTLAAKRHTH